MKHAAVLLPLLLLGCLLALGGTLWHRPVPRADIVATGTGLRLALNTAGPAALMLLPGIGHAAAERIVADRRVGGHGPFRQVSDLRRIRGFSERLVANLEPYVRIGSAD